MTFGAELHDALEEIGHGAGVLSRFSYEERQTLRAADRDDVLALLRPVLNYAEIQRVKNVTAREVAEFLCRVAPDAQAHADPSLPFGGQLYQELRGRGLGSLVTGELDYAEVQALKEADREGTLRLLRSHLDYAAIQRLKEDEPAVVADYLCCRHLQLTAVNQGGATWPFWLFFMVMLP